MDASAAQNHGMTAIAHPIAPIWKQNKALIVVMRLEGPLSCRIEGWRLNVAICDAAPQNNKYRCGVDGYDAPNVQGSVYVHLYLASTISAGQAQQRDRRTSQNYRSLLLEYMRTTWRASTCWKAAMKERCALWLDSVACLRSTRGDQFPEFSIFFCFENRRNYTKHAAPRPWFGFLSCVRNYGYICFHKSLASRSTTPCKPIGQARQAAGRAAKLSYTDRASKAIPTDLWRGRYSARAVICRRVRVSHR